MSFDNQKSDFNSPTANYVEKDGCRCSNRSDSSSGVFSSEEVSLAGRLKINAVESSDKTLSDTAFNDEESKNNSVPVDLDVDAHPASLSSSLGCGNSDADDTSFLVDSNLCNDHRTPVTDINHSSVGPSETNDLKNAKYLAHHLLSKAHQSLLQSHDLVMEDCSIRSAASAIVHAPEKTSIATANSNDDSTEPYNGSFGCLCSLLQCCR